MKYCPTLPRCSVSNMNVESGGICEHGLGVAIQFSCSVVALLRLLVLPRCAIIGFPLQKKVAL